MITAKRALLATAVVAAVLIAAALPAAADDDFIPASKVGNCEDQAPPVPTPRTKRFILVADDSATEGLGAKIKATSRASAAAYKSVLAAGNDYMANCPDLKLTRLYKDVVRGFAFELPADSPCAAVDPPGSDDGDGGDGGRRRRSLLSALAADSSVAVYPDTTVWVGAASCRAAIAGDMNDQDGGGVDGGDGGDGAGEEKSVSVLGDDTPPARGPTYPLIPETEVPLGVQRIMASAVRGNRTFVNGPSTVDIALLSTGVAMHPDLNIAGSVDCATSQLVGNSSMWPPAIRGCRVRASPKDIEWAGTAMAGIAAARNGWDQPRPGDVPRHGIVGVAPGTPLWGIGVAAPLIDVNAPPGTTHANSFTSWSDILAALDWIKAHNSQVAPKRRKIRVVLMPFEFAREARYNSSDLINIIGRPTAYPRCGVGHPKVHPVKAAICALGQDRANGAVVVASAGNTAQPLDNVVPAAWPEVLTVTAMADGNGKLGGPRFNLCGEGYRTDNFARWSNYVLVNDTNTETHMVAAPGLCLKTSLPYDTTRTEYGRVSGTEFAAAHVAGAVALCFGELKTNINYAPALIDANVNGRCKTIFEASGAPAVLSYLVRNKMFRLSRFIGDASDPTLCPGETRDPENPGAGSCWRHFGYLFNAFNL